MKRMIKKNLKLVTLFSLSCLHFYMSTLLGDRIEGGPGLLQDTLVLVRQHHHQHSTRPQQWLCRQENKCSDRSVGNVINFKEIMTDRQIDWQTIQQTDMSFHWEFIFLKTVTSSEGLKIQYLVNKIIFSLVLWICYSDLNP